MKRLPDDCFNSTHQLMSCSGHQAKNACTATPRRNPSSCPPSVYVYPFRAIQLVSKTHSAAPRLKQLLPGTTVKPPSPRRLP